MLSRPGTDVPRGTVTFLFTDMEGSTRLLQQIGAAYAAVLETQRRLARDAFEGHHGRIVDTAGDGFFVVFERARDAVSAAVDAQRALHAHHWPDGATVRVRMGIHTGEPVASGTGYVGLDVHRAARIMAAAHGQQIVVSETTRHLIAGELPGGVTLLDLGEHRLKDLPQSERLYQVVGDGLPSSFPPLRTAGRVLSDTLPSRAVRLVGRDDDVAAVRSLLLRDDVRLLTLTGTGGTGKTSLAVEAAAQCISEFRDGVAYVPLAPVTDPALVFSAVAQTLAVSPHGDQRVIEAVTEHLRDRQLLLVLDNFEHVLDAVSDVASLVAACSALKVLVTSRFALRLSMEREFPVSPLRTPVPTATATAATLRDYPAVELFTQRAAAVKPGFGLDDDSALAVAEICHRLDGLPLAIELAAARIKLFSPRALLMRLDRRLELLSGGARDLPARHRTLRQAIAWSYDLLEPGEQAVFRRLAVFANGFSLEAAEPVCAAAGEPALPALEGIAALVDKSLLRQESGEDDEPRFAMLETVREFALEQLAASGDESATRAAHADVLIALAEASAPKLTGAEQAAWLPRLQREHDDMRAAFDWLVRTRDASRALRLGAALCRFWIIRGFHTEGRQRLRAALALAYRSEDRPVRTRVLSGAAVLAYEQADLLEAQRLLHDALEHYREVGDERGIAETLNHIGWVNFYSGDLHQGTALTEEARAIHEKRGDTRGLALSLTNLGAIAMQRGDLQRARELHGRALELRRGLNDARGVAYGEINYAWSLSRLGQLDDAHRLAASAECTLRALGDKQILAFACFMLGEVALERGQMQQAVPLLEEAVSLGREIMQGSSLGLALGVYAEALAKAGDVERAVPAAREATALHRAGATYTWLVLSSRCEGDVLRLAGRAADAASSYRSALELAAPRRMHLYAAECAAGLAALAFAADDHARAIRMSAASRAWRELSGAPPSRRNPDLDAIEAASGQLLDAATAARERARGAAVDLQQFDQLLG